MIVSCGVSETECGLAELFEGLAGCEASLDHSLNDSAEGAFVMDFNSGRRLPRWRGDEQMPPRVFRCELGGRGESDWLFWESGESGGRRRGGLLRFAMAAWGETEFACSSLDLGLIWVECLRLGGLFFGCFRLAEVLRSSGGAEEGRGSTWLLCEACVS